MNTGYRLLRDPRLNNVDLRGFIKFSLSTLPSWAQITSIQLALNAGQVNGGTTPTPVLQILYSPNTGWTEAAIPTPTDMGTSPLVVSAQFGSGAVGWQYFAVNIGGHDWSTDIAAISEICNLTPPRAIPKPASGGYFFTGEAPPSSSQRMGQSFFSFDGWESDDRHSVPKETIVAPNSASRS